MTSFKPAAAPVISRREAGLMLLSGIALAGCQKVDVERPALTQPGPGIDLGVASIDIINDYTSPGVRPYIDHIYLPAPVQQLSEWARMKLYPVEDRGNLLITITRAAMTEENLESSESLAALFTNEQSRLIRVEMQAIFSFSHPRNNRSATLTVVSNYETSIADNTTPAEADDIRYRTVQEGIGRFDQEFRNQLAAASSNGWPQL